MTGQAIIVRGAGRTDAGVHAEGQVASVEVASRIPALGFLRGLNTHLPPEIAVLEVADVPAGFNARHDARGKIYRYRVWNHPVRSPRYARVAGTSTIRSTRTPCARRPRGWWASTTSARFARPTATARTPCASCAASRCAATERSSRSRSRARPFCATWCASWPAPWSPSAKAR
jgi:tRNA U38,U39,U40 pseudouridine synthase TruA